MPTDQLVEGGQLGGERRAPGSGDPHPGPRPAPLVALLDLDQASFLEHHQVPGQVAGRQAKRIAQVTKIGSPRFGRDREGAEPVPLMDRVIKPVGGMRRAAGRGLGWPFAAHVGRIRRRATNATAPATAPAISSTAAGSSTPGSTVSDKSALPGFHPSRNRMFSTLYRLARRAAPVYTAAVITRATLRSARASTHKPTAMMRNANVPRIHMSPGRTSHSHCNWCALADSGGMTTASAVSTTPVTRYPRAGVCTPARRACHR